MYVLFCIVFVYYLCVLHVQYIFDTNFQNCAAKQKAGYLTELLNVNVVTCKIQMQMIKIISLDLL